MSENTINVHVPSDIAELREVLIGPFKPFTIDGLLAEAADAGEPDPYNERIAAEVEARGIIPVPIDYSEITRFPGGLHCSTLPLIRG